MKRVLLVTLAVIAAGIGVAALVAWLRWFRPIPDSAQGLGPFEIVTHYTRYTYGWNEGQLRRGVTEHYSLRWRGKPFTFQGPGGMFGDSTEEYGAVNAIVTFPSPEPAAVVNAGDPNNSSHYFLVREVGGRARAEYLGPSSGNVSADWLDPPADSAGQRDLAVHRKHLEGGRWLLLGEQTVLDTRTLKWYRVEHHPNAYPHPSRAAIAMSPDGHSFARLASGASPQNAPLVLVHDFTAGASYALPVERGTMRYVDLEEIDAAWLAHHFEWKAAEGGRQRLEPRAGAEPLPFHGRLTADPYDGARSYHLAPVKAEMRDTLAAFIAREMGAERVRSPYPETETVKIGESEIHVMWHGADIPGEDSYASVSMNLGADTAPVAEIARRFDAALRTGRYDALFVQ
jgi:hypothetical protein